MSAGFTLVSSHPILSNHEERMSRRGEQRHPSGCAAMNQIPTGDNRLKQDQNPKKPQSITK